MERTQDDNRHDPVPPPVLRKLVLVSAAVLLLAVGLVASGTSYSSAQSTPLMDYDLDDDNLIEVRTRAQYLAIHHDMNGDGSATTVNSGGYNTGVTWATAFPNAMPNGGCPLRDHDDNAQTPDARQCLGYELVEDIDFNGQTFVPLGKTGHGTVNNFHATLLGNGFRILNPYRQGSNSGQGGNFYGVIGVMGFGSLVEGLGVVNPRWDAGQAGHGGITGELKATLRGSYVHGGTVHGGGNSGGLVGVIDNRAADTSPNRYWPNFSGKIYHSYVDGTRVEDAIRTGGLVGSWDADAGTTADLIGVCLNSYFSGTVHVSGPALAHGLIAGTKSGGTITNCVADSTTDSDDSHVWDGASSTQNNAHTATKAAMIAATGYNTPASNPFSNFEDYNAAGAAIAAGQPRADHWDFGDATTLPRLKYWGHDRSAARARGQSGTDTVNLCTRTIAVANEIIRLLKDSDVRSGAPAIPSAISTMTDCGSSADTRDVTITQLTDYAVTTEANPFNLNPSRTSPAATKLTSLDTNDFAYLSNVSHFNLSGNSFTTLPNRLFQGVPLRQLDLSDNALVTLPADLFAGMAAVTATTDNMLFLNGNALTYTGIADRVFDDFDYLNGLDLSDNALTRVNTRWFRELALLGSRPATGAAFRDKLGLHLAGNSITEHYYSTKLYTGVIENRVTYTGSTAGDTLKTAIEAAITARAGGTTPTTLAIDAVEHFDNTAVTPAYLAVNDTCPTTGTAGPAGKYLNDDTADCYIAPNWSPPYVVGATTAAPSALTTVAYPDVITTSTSHTASTGFIAYQIRYRATPATPTDPFTEDWLYMPITMDAGTKTATISGLTVTTAYQLQVRALSMTGAPSAVVAAAVTTLTTPAAPTGLTATTSTDTPSAVALSWTALPIDPGANEQYLWRSKLSTASSYGSWTQIAGSDYETDSYVATGLTSGSAYDFQIQFQWTTGLVSSASASARATASGVPTPGNFAATPGSAAGEIDLSWDAVASVTGYQFRCNPAGTMCTDTWEPAGTGTTHALTGLTAGEVYMLELRASTATGQSPAATATATAQTHPGPRNLAATNGTNPGDINVTWDAPASVTGTLTRYESRHKASAEADSEYSTWTRVPDANSDNDFTNDRTLALTELMGATAYVIQLRVVITDSASMEDESLPVQVTHTTAAVPAPTMFMAVAGTGPGQVALSWTGVSNALRYESRNQPSGGEWTSWGSVGTGSSFTLTGLRGGTTHAFELRTFMTGAGPSTAVTASAVSPVLPPPATYSATTGALPGEIVITWAAVTGATGYEYRVKPTTENWPADSWVLVSGGAMTTTTVSGLTPGVSHNVELRADAGTIGKSTVEEAQADSGGGEVTGDAMIPTGYSIATGTMPGIVTITIPPSTNPFIYRTRTSNPGEWSNWLAVRPAGTDTSYDVPGLTAGVAYDFELRVYLGSDDGYTTALTANAVEALELDGPADFTVSVSSGTLVLRWTNPNSLDAVRYEYRQRAAGTATWSDWTSVDHEGARDSQQQLFIPGLESGVEYSFEMRIQTSAGVSPVTTAGATSRVSLPEIQRITPEVREVTVRAGDQVRLGVDLYNLQDRLDNGKATEENVLLVFRWTEVGAGGGTFGTPNNARQVAYTAPSSPGNYTITAEAQPDGICSTHHEEASAISAANRAPCIATFTIRVTRAPGPIGPQADPVNPSGAIPTSMTDSGGAAYSVFTPAEGGTFTGEGFTVSATAGAVPDRTLLGVNASISVLPPSPPVPGAGMTVAGNFYDVNGINQDGGQPLSNYSLDAPLTVCLPFPNEFRADLSDVVVVSRGIDGALSILTTKVRTNAGVLTVCGAVSNLPSTVAVAKLGAVVIPTATPTPTVETPDTGATAPSAGAIALLLLLGVILLASLYSTTAAIRR